MPIRKTAQGWFWGSKGPFDSKMKAIAVGRAAHASGFNEQQVEATNGTCASFVLTLLHSVTSVHVLHLQTRSYSMHKALQKYYEGIGDLTDSLVEGYQGKYGLIEGYPDGWEMPEGPIDYLIYIAEYVERHRYDEFEDTYLQNIIDEILGLTYSTLYKLRLLS